MISVSGFAESSTVRTPLSREPRRRYGPGLARKDAVCTSMWSSPTSRRISIVAPSIVPIVSAPLSANSILLVPEASVPAVDSLTGPRLSGW